jgi:hypothetical protein
MTRTSHGTDVSGAMFCWMLCKRWRKHTVGGLIPQPASTRRGGSGEQRLRAGVVPTVAFAAHRGRDSALLQHLIEVVAGILATAITVEDQLCLSIWAALKLGHLQGVDD